MALRVIAGRGVALVMMARFDGCAGDGELFSMAIEGWRAARRALRAWFSWWLGVLAGIRTRPHPPRRGTPNVITIKIENKTKCVIGSMLVDCVFCLVFVYWRFERWQTLAVQ